MLTLSPPPRDVCPRAVASLNTPYRPADPAVDIVEKMKTYPTFDYQFYFQEPVSPGPQFLSSAPLLGLKPSPPPSMGMCPCRDPQLTAGHRLPHSQGATPWGSRCHPSCKNGLPDLVPMLNSAKKTPSPASTRAPTGGRIQPRGGLGPWGGLASPAVLPPPVQGVAEAELEKDIGRTLKVLIRSTCREVGLGLRVDLGWEQRASQGDVLSKPS